MPGKKHMKKTNTHLENLLAPTLSDLGSVALPPTCVDELIYINDSKTQVLILSNFFLFFCFFQPIFL